MAALGRESETPERLWNMSMAMTTAEEVASLAASARLAQVCFCSTAARLSCMHGRKHATCWKYICGGIWV